MNNLKEMIMLFFKMGLVAFGGPAAHIAMIHKEVVDRRNWMNEDHFLDLVGATSLIPGPNSTEMVIHCGYHRGGLSGLFIAGVSFILPACLLTGFLAYLYTEASNIPNFDSYIIGIKPIVIILILQALKKLWKKAIKRNELIIVAFAVVAFGFLQMGEVYALLIGSVLGFALFSVRDSFIQRSIALPTIFLVFLKIGSVLFGSGYVLIAYLQDEIVEQRGWLTSMQIADAIALGQFTPGPVLSTSTFIGYLLGGVDGATVASIGIFLPSFVFVLILNPLIPKMRDSKSFSLLLDCINAGAVGLMVYALYPLGAVSLMRIDTMFIFILGSALTYFFPKISSIKLVLLGILATITLTLLGLS